MPIPFIALAIGAGAAALRVGKGVKAAVDNSKAKDINADANTIINNAKKQLETCRNKSQQSLEALGRKKGLPAL